MSRKWLPVEFSEKWQSKADGVTFFDIPVKQMAACDLIAAVSYFADRYRLDPYPYPRPAKPALVPHEGFTYTVIGGNL
jgi:hypothetical protein